MFFSSPALYAFLSLYLFYASSSPDLNYDISMFSTNNSSASQNITEYDYYYSSTVNETNTTAEDACSLCVCYYRKTVSGVPKLYVDCMYNYPPLTQLPIIPQNTSRLILTGNLLKDIGK